MEARDQIIALAGSSESGARESRDLLGVDDGGGPLTFSNPVPLAPYVDVIVMGEGDALAGELGVTHAADLGFVFDTLEHSDGSLYDPMDDDARRTAAMWSRQQRSPRTYGTRAASSTIRGRNAAAWVCSTRRPSRPSWRSWGSAS